MENDAYPPAKAFMHYELVMHISNMRSAECNCSKNDRVVVESHLQKFFKDGD